MILSARPSFTNAKSGRRRDDIHPYQILENIRRSYPTSKSYAVCYWSRPAHLSKVIALQNEASTTNEERNNALDFLGSLLI